MSHQLPYSFERPNMEATASFQHEEQLAALYEHNHRLFWKVDEAEEDVDQIKRRIHRHTTENLEQQLCAAKTAVRRAQEQFNSSCEVLTYISGKVPESERMGIRARCMVRISYKSERRQPYFIRRHHQRPHRHY